MDNRKRIFLLLIINIGISILFIYILDMLQIIDYKQLLGNVPGMKQAYVVKIEDPFLLNKMEINKKWEVLNENLLNYSNDLEKLEKEYQTLSNQLEELALEKEAVQNMIDNYNKEIENRKEYEKRVQEVALQIEGMRPDAAVDILSKQDDMMIIDLFRMMNAKAEEEGRVSQVPNYLQLMDSEQAARIQRKMLRSDNDF